MALMRWSRVALAVAVLLSSTLAAAQEQTGSLEGLVRDAQGGVLPGVTVEAHHLAVGAVVTLVTDANGAFRFAAVPPGYYDVDATLTGFVVQKFERVEVLLGQIKRLDFTLAVAGLSEQVEVVAASPLVDVKQSSRGFSLREEQLGLLTPGIDFQRAVPLLPGSNNEPKLGGLSIDGSSAAENRFVVDGMNATDLVIGTAAYPVSLDAVEELQVKSSGYTAEYGGATGGVVSLITKSGTDAWRGDARLYFSGDALDAGPRPTLRRNLQNSSLAEYVTYPEDPYTKYEPAGSIGGPIARGRAWFYGSYQPQLRWQERTVTFNPPYEGTGTYDQRKYTHLFTGSQSTQVGTKLRTRVAGSGYAEPVDGVLPAQAGSDPPTAQFDITSQITSWTLSGTADWLPSPRFFVSGRVGWYGWDAEQGNVREVPRYVFSRSNIGLLDVPVAYQRVTGFSNERSIWAGWQRDRRVGAQVDATWYLHFAGQHTLKAGVQAEWMSSDVDNSQVRNQVNLQWNRAVLGQRGKYGYYTVTSNTIDPRRGAYYRGLAEGSAPGPGIFVQDAWAMGPRLTVNVGLRSEREAVPGFGQGDEDVPPIIEFGFRDKIAPRLGAAWDVRGDGRWKVYGSWGVFYDIFKYRAATGFGVLHTQTYYYTLNTYEWPTLVDAPGCPPACPGQLIFLFNSGSESPIDPGLEPMKLQEATVGLEHQLRPNLSVAARYVHKQLDRAVEDIGAQDANYQEVYLIGNPGYGVAAFAYPGVRLPKAKREYDAVELSVRKLLSDGWSFNANYVWSRLYGNMSGLSQSDEEGRVAPNIGRAYDYPAMMFDEKGQPVYGPLATDRPHQFKAFATYAWNFGLTASLFEFVGSGLPITRTAGILPPSYYPVMYLGRMSDGRTPTLSQTDVYLQQEFWRSSRTRLSVGVGVTNLFNQDEVISVFPSETDVASGIVLDEADFYAGRLDFAQLMAQQRVPKDPRFLMAQAYQAPRSAKVIVKVTF